jgi:hypothetical protein
VPPPLFVTDDVFEEGLPPPWTAEKLRLVGERAIAGEGEETTKLTATVCGLLVATPELIDTVALYVPAVSCPVVGCTVRVAGALVVFRDALSQPLPLV